MGCPGYDFTVPVHAALRICFTPQTLLFLHSIFMSSSSPFFCATLRPRPPPGSGRNLVLHFVVNTPKLGQASSTNLHLPISKRCISASFESCGLRFHRKINPGLEFRFLVVSNQYVYFRSRIAFGAPMLLRAGPSIPPLLLTRFQQGGE